MGPDTDAPYRVLARSYRPTRLSELVGQDALVRTLTRAFETGRIAHAFLLTGIRGVGKTTTARILARGLNCTGPDGRGGPTAEPCGQCASCRMIAEERSLDVIETDAASHTGKDDVQEIIEGVKYAPAASRFKVYIFDEVHMLSEKAWNSLLKTIEEPPPHVKFIFATTEVRKVPLTVLSRCQRFDLRRVEADRLVAHLADVCGREGIRAEERALGLIARAAEGSVRDALSLLDQAVTAGGGTVTAAEVEAMLGLADRAKLFDLFEAILDGEAARAVERFGELYARGADPVAAVRDLLDLVHWLTRIRLDREAAQELGFGEELAARARALAMRRDHPHLQRLWQMLLRGLEEVRLAPDAQAALEMLLVRLCCVADLPPPHELVRLLRSSGSSAAAAATEKAPPAPGAAPLAGAEGERRRETAAVVIDGARSVHEALRRAGEALLAAWFYRGARVLRVEPGRLLLALEAGVPRSFAGELAGALERITGRRWIVALGGEGEAPTLAEEDAREREVRLRELEKVPLVARALEVFPGARLVDIREDADHLGEEQEGRRTGEG